VLVQIGRERHEVGKVDDTAYIRDIHAGRSVITTLIQEGLLAPGRKLVFEYVFHATDVETWLAYREERSTRSVLHPSTVSSVRELLSKSGGEILVVNRGYASYLTRREKPDRKRSRAILRGPDNGEV
jgi:hypothetical protein